MYCASVLRRCEGRSGARLIRPGQAGTLSLVSLAVRSNLHRELIMKRHLVWGLCGCLAGLLSLSGCSDPEDTGKDNNKTNNAKNNAQNQPPVAEAGKNRIVPIGQRVEVSAADSTDPEGQVLTVRWTMERPEGSQATLENADKFRASFVPDVVGDYVLTVTVSDGQQEASDRVTIRATLTGNRAPVADAGMDRTVPLGLMVTLDGSGSEDADGDALTYAWSVVSRPTGSSAMLTGATTVKPTLAPDVPGEYTIGLVVNDGELSSAQDTMRLVVLPQTPVNTKPIAEAGSDRRVKLGEPVALDGSGSMDADGDALTFAWSIVERPAGSTAALPSPSSPQVTFTPDAIGLYRLELVVNDGTEDSAPDQVTVQVTDPNASGPTADAGPDFTARQGQAITLDASRSTHPDNLPLTFRWVLLSKPAGSLVFLQDATSAMARLTPDRLGDYQLELIASDGVNESRDQLKITVIEGSTICLILSKYAEGSGNNKAIELFNCGGLMLDMTRIGVCLVQNDARTCSSTMKLMGLLQPSQTFGVCHSSIAPGKVPAGECKMSNTPVMAFNGDDRLIVFEDVNGDGLFDSQDFVLDAFGQTAVRPSGTPWQDVTYRRCNFSPYDGVAPFDVSAYFNVGIFDDFSEFGRPPVMGCGVANQAPTASIQGPTMGRTGLVLALDGSGSSDPEGDALTYRWRLAQAPAGSLASLSSTSAATTQLTPDLGGDYVVELVVNDGRQDSVASTLTIQVQAPPRPSACLILSEYIEGSGNNRAVELFNCGHVELDLSRFGLCVASNEATSCTAGTILSGTLARGRTLGVCNNSLDMSLVDAGDCGLIVPAVTSFSGDDRLVLYEDLDQSGTLSQGDVIMDAFGQTAVQPPSNIWANKGYRRCDFTFYDGVAPFNASDRWVEVATPDDFTNLGVAPTVSCRQGANRAPQAVVGPNLTQAVAAPASLDGTASFDLDNDPLTFQWSLIQAPMMSMAAFDDATSPSPTLTTDLDGTYVVELVVSDGALTHSAQLTVRVGVVLPSQCLIISEYIEGSSNNKALELFNCGTSPIDLTKVGICNYANAATTCAGNMTMMLNPMPPASATLAPGQVFGLCNGSTSMGLVPMGACQQLGAMPMGFNGDDRILVFLDEDGSGSYSMGDQTLDAFGQLAVRPASPIWADKTYRRCDWTPFDGLSVFSVDAMYTTHGVDDFSGFGVAPTAMICP